MTASLTRKIELAANVAIVLSGLVVTGLFARSFMHTSAAKPPMVAAGMKLKLPSVNWSDHDATLVVAVREGCQFCEASAPFYKQLMEAAAKSTKTHVIAALPESPVDGKAFLAKLGVPAEDVREADFDEMKVQYTPTVLLLDREGRVKNVWVGRLKDDEEKQVLQAAGLD